MIRFLLLVVVVSLNYIEAEALSGEATYYDLSVGLTACGTQHSNSELVAATSFSWWTSANPNNDPMCRRTAVVRNPSNGRSVTVRIRDKCWGCKREDIDLSPAAFQALGVPLSVGRFRVNWDFQ